MKPRKKNSSARARRSSVMEAHNVFDVYHKHQEISAEFEELSTQMEAEDATDDAEAGLQRVSELENHKVPDRKSKPSFPQFHKGTYFLVLCLFISIQYIMYVQ
jgi:hypothetical protein